MSDYLPEYSRVRSARQGIGARPLIGAVIGAFLLGGAVTGYIGYRAGWLFSGDETAIAAPDSQQPAPATTPTPMAEVAREGAPAPISEADPELPAATAEEVERVAEQQGGLGQRLVALEQRISRLDLQAEAAAGHVARAEGLLIAFAARRSIERGHELGYIAEELRLRFGDAEPKAVETIIDAAGEPVTLDQLMAQLEGLQEGLSSVPSDEGILPMLRREFGNLFVVRREETPSPQPERRLERAKRFLESARVGAAAAEVENMPGAQTPEAEEWIAKAQRYAAVQSALERVETAAIRETDDLRDSDGNRVEETGALGEG